MLRCVTATQPEYVIKNTDSLRKDSILEKLSFGGLHFLKAIQHIIQAIIEISYIHCRNDSDILKKCGMPKKCTPYFNY